VELGVPAAASPDDLLHHLVGDLHPDADVYRVVPHADAQPLHEADEPTGAYAARGQQYGVSLLRAIVRLHCLNPSSLHPEVLCLGLQKELNSSLLEALPEAAYHLGKVVRADVVLEYLHELYSCLGRPPLQVPETLLVVACLTHTQAAEDVPHPEDELPGLTLGEKLC